METELRSQAYKENVELFLRNYYQQFANEPQSELFDAITYSLLAGGKRLRPIFAQEFCRMCCGTSAPAIPFAAAVEMIHTYSLIHDDLPCMDNDDYRRGRLTNHKVYGEGLATLAGDALLTDAFSVAASAKLLNPEGTILAISVLSECAGSLGMVGGQVLDIKSEERMLTEQEILDIQSRKTGRLFNAACVLGVIAGGGSETQVEAAAGFANLLGLAFQIRDDMLDLIGTQQEMGKGVGTDSAKNTFVRLYGLEKCEELVEKYTAAALKELEGFEDHEYLHDLSLELCGRRN